MGRNSANQPTAQFFQFRIDRVHARIDADEQIVIGFVHARLRPRPVADSMVDCVDVIGNTTHITRHRAWRTVILLSELVFWLASNHLSCVHSGHDTTSRTSMATRADRVAPDDAPWWCHLGIHLLARHHWYNPPLGGWTFADWCALILQPLLPGAAL